MSSLENPNDLFHLIVTPHQFNTGQTGAVCLHSPTRVISPRFFWVTALSNRDQALTLSESHNYSRRSELLTREGRDDAMFESAVTDANVAKSIWVTLDWFISTRITFQMLLLGALCCICVVLRWSQLWLWWVHVLLVKTVSIRFEADKCISNIA